MDGYTLTLAANPWNIVRTYNLTPGRELLFACRYRLGTASNFVVYMSEADNVYDPLYGSFAGDQGAWSTAKMYFTVPPNGVAKLHFGAHFQAPGLPNQTAGTVDVYGLQILDATLEAGNTVEEDTAASALLLKHEFLDGGADDVTLATLGEVLLEPTTWKFSGALRAPWPRAGLRHDPERLCLEHRARLHADAGERYSFGCRCRLGTASNLVMYVSATTWTSQAPSSARPCRARRAWTSRCWEKHYLPDAWKKAWIEGQIMSLKQEGRWVGGEPSTSKQLRLMREDCWFCSICMLGGE